MQLVPSQIDLRVHVVLLAIAVCENVSYQYKATGNSLTVVDTDAFKDELVEALTVLMRYTAEIDYLRRVHRIDWGRLEEILMRSAGIRPCVTVHTKKMGCFRANFSTPPLMMLVLKVIIPACTRISRYSMLQLTDAPSQWHHRRTSEQAIKNPMTLQCTCHIPRPIAGIRFRLSVAGTVQTHIALRKVQIPNGEIGTLDEHREVASRTPTCTLVNANADADAAPTVIRTLTSRGF